MALSHLHLAFCDAPAARRFFANVLQLPIERVDESNAIVQVGQHEVCVHPDWGQGDSALTLALSTLDCVGDHRAAVARGARERDPPTLRKASINSSIWGPGKLVIEFEQRLEIPGNDALIAALQNEELLSVLHAIEGLGQHFWLCAGAIRNTVWNHLSGLPIDLNTDVDVVYMDDSDVSQQTERDLEQQLVQRGPAVNWSVKNQARMAAKYGTSASTLVESVAGFPETATSVCVRTVEERFVVLAPHGLADLLAMRVRATPAFASRLDVVRARVEEKGWQRRWPALTVELPDDACR